MLIASMARPGCGMNVDWLLDESAGNGVLDSCQCIADFNLDGAVDGGDIETFFARWEAGC